MNCTVKKNEGKELCGTRCCMGNNSRSMESYNIFPTSWSCISSYLRNADLYKRKTHPLPYNLGKMFCTCSKWEYYCFMLSGLCFGTKRRVLGHKSWEPWLKVKLCVVLIYYQISRAILEAWSAVLVTPCTAHKYQLFFQRYANCVSFVELSLIWPSD